MNLFVPQSEWCDAYLTGGCVLRTLLVAGGERLKSLFVYAECTWTHFDPKIKVPNRFSIAIVISTVSGKCAHNVIALKTFTCVCNVISVLYRWWYLRWLSLIFSVSLFRLPCSSKLLVEIMQELLFPNLSLVAHLDVQRYLWSNEQKDCCLTLQIQFSLGFGTGNYQKLLASSKVWEISANCRLNWVYFWKSLHLLEWHNASISTTWLQKTFHWSLC